jgi:hypothetical protein
MSFERDSLEFGSGHFVGDAFDDPALNGLSPQDIAKTIGFAAGCPVVDELTSPDNPDPNRGPEAMIRRYGELGFWFTYMEDTAQRLNPDLHDQLVKPVARLPHEPIGKYEPQSVPESYLHEIPPTETLVGFAMPRLMTKNTGGGEVPYETRQDRLVRGLDFLERSIAEAQTPEEMLAHFADRVASADLDPITTLRTILPAGWYEEQNAESMVVAAKEALRTYAPQLWLRYAALTDQEKSDLSIL